jgi:RNA polymerase sigma-70 factor (ECF subfamily)
MSLEQAGFQPTAGRVPRRTLTEIDEWLTLTARGDRVAFRRLYDGTSGKLFAQALAMLRRRDAAEDALQEAYVRIWKRAGDYDSNLGPATPWMMQVLRNIVIDQMRRERSAIHQCDFEEYARELPAPCVPVDDRIDLAQAMAQLSEAQQAAVNTVVIQGWTNEEAGRRHGVPTPTAKARVARGLKKLRTCLEQAEPSWSCLK